MIERVVQINDLSEPLGGASRLAVKAACGLAARGHAVTFIAGDGGDSAALRAAGVGIVALGQPRLLAGGRARGMVSGLWNRAAHAMVRDWIAVHDTPATAYHLHGWSQILSPAVFAALAPVRERLVVSAHDFFLACPNGAFASLRSGEPCPRTPLSAACLAAPCDRDGAAHKLWRAARHAVQRRAYRPGASPPVLAIHAGMGDRLVRGGVSRDAIRVLPNPVEPFAPARIAAERNRQVLFVGRLEASKGADLAAAAAFRAGAPLTVVGEGPLAAEVRRLHPQARLAGRCDPAEIRRLAADARLLVMPSRYPEPFGLVALEAAWSGLPVILAPTALLAPDLVAVGAGLAVDPRDTAAFAAAIRDLGRDDGAVRAMSEAAFGGTRTLGLTPFAWIARLEEILAGCVANARRSGPAAALR
ncbi:glycosyltransferase family 4 protein [Novosphingobium soli]|uniref:Glycosyltransferase family 4 protein n=1 Tax=Novosphingobium soli TaxID=574956 RepID=A0ABV6CXZ3_9SPHN